jgi:hypothetical protein
VDGKYVFISYKVEEFDQAMAVKNHLEANYIPCWMAPMSIRGGQSYAQEIPPAIHNCSAFVLILSRKAQESKWVPRELDQAINSEKVVLPYVVENCPLRSDFSFYLTNVQRYDAFREPEAALDRMTTDIQRLLDITPPPPPEESEPEVPAEPPKPKVVKPKPPKKEVKPTGKKKLPLPLIIGGAVLVVALLLFLLMPGKQSVGGMEFDYDDFSVNLDCVTLTQADIDQFSNFTDLSVIRLTNCTIQAHDLSALTGSSLMSLQLENCGLTDAQFATLDFSQPSYFNELDVSNNPGLTSLAGLEHTAAKLTELDISDTGITSFDWLPTFNKLEYFYADRTGLKDTGVFESLIYLEELSLSGNGITSLEGLKNTSKLTKVDFSHNNLTDVSVLSRSAATLTVVHLEDNQLTDLTCLSAATGLHNVYVDNNQLTDLDWLENGQEIRVLSASHNNIDNLIQLVFSSKLRCLDLSYNRLNAIWSDELSLAADTYLLLNLCGNDMNYLELPEGCTYKNLILLGNPELDLDDLGQISGWNLYFDFPADVELQTLKDLSFSTLQIVNIPLSRQVEIEEGLNNEDLLTEAEALEAIAQAIANEDY